MSHLNWLAVVVAAVVTFLIGGLWYSPLLFAKQWAKAHGYSDERLKEMQKGAAKAYGLSFIAFLVMATVLAMLVAHTLDLTHRQRA